MTTTDARIENTAEQTRKLDELRVVLEPFSKFYRRMLKSNDYSYMQERVVDWFGVSDFKIAHELWKQTERKEPKP